MQGRTIEGDGYFVARGGVVGHLEKQLHVGGTSIVGGQVEGRAIAGQRPVQINGDLAVDAVVLFGVLAQRIDARAAVDGCVGPR